MRLLKSIKGWIKVIKVMKTSSLASQIEKQINDLNGMKITTSTIIEGEVLKTGSNPEGKVESSIKVSYQVDKNNLSINVEMDNKSYQVRVKRAWFTKLVKALINFIELFDGIEKNIKVIEK